MIEVPPAALRALALSLCVFGLGCGGDPDPEMEAVLLGFWHETTSVGAVKVDTSGYAWGAKIEESGDVTKTRTTWSTGVTSEEARGAMFRFLRATGGTFETSGGDSGSYTRSTAYQPSSDKTFPFLILDITGDPTQYYVKTLNLDGSSPQVAHSSTGVNAGIWDDSTSGATLHWQIPPASGTYRWAAATSYCDDLDWAGESDWRMPTISELRSLVRGCSKSETSGACAVTDACLALSSCNNNCDPCTSIAGPGTGGCYWDSELSGACQWYWSSSTRTDGTYAAWGVGFSTAVVSYATKDTYDFHVRCVR